MRIYGDVASGNCYKIKLICAFLEIKYDWVAIDILKGGTRTEAFLRLNPNGQIPVLVDENDVTITESNAILYYLGQGSRFWPDAQLSQTRVLQWMFFEQYSHEPSIAVARFIALYLGLPESRRAEYDSKHKSGYRALDVMETTLQENTFLIGDNMTLADIALFAYTHVAHEGGFDLSRYDAINRWLEAIKATSRYVAMSD